LRRFGLWLAGAVELLITLIREQRNAAKRRIFWL